ncbi:MULTISPECIES: hypothetical protein [Salinibaculum]|uniref:hypothetical protein n=1 Tax=Salinibaculum TaxID=2732368 RepID=UPI0030CAA566
MTDTARPVAEARQQLHEIVRKDIPFDEKAREALELARQCLDVDSGFLARIDQETNHWGVETTTDTANGQIPPSLAVDLQETYCRKTIKKKRSTRTSRCTEPGMG